MSNTTGATYGAGSAYLSGAPEIGPSFWWGSCCLFSILFFSFLCCVMCTIVCLFVSFILSHGVVSLFLISEFDCPSGILRPSFTMFVYTAFVLIILRKDNLVSSISYYGNTCHVSISRFIICMSYLEYRY